MNAIPLLKARRHDADGATSYVVAVDALAPIAWSCGSCGRLWRDEAHAGDCCITSKRDTLPGLDELDDTARRTARLIKAGNIPVAVVALDLLVRNTTGGLRALLQAVSLRISPDPIVPRNG